MTEAPSRIAGLEGMSLATGFSWNDYYFSFGDKHGTVYLDYGYVTVRLIEPCCEARASKLAIGACSECQARPHSMRWLDRSKTLLYFSSSEKQCGTWKKSGVDEWYQSGMLDLEGQDPLSATLEASLFQSELLRVERGVAEYWSHFEEALALTGAEWGAGEAAFWSEANQDFIGRFNGGDEFTRGGLMPDPRLRRKMG